MEEQERNRFLAAAIAAGRSPLNDELIETMRAMAKANLDVSGPRVLQLIELLDTYRASVTTGGPPAPFTQRPDEVVELAVAVPVTAEQAQTMAYGPCEDCGVRHPTWISCEAEARTHPQ